MFQRSRELLGWWKQQLRRREARRVASSCAAITETGKAGQTRFSEDDWTDASHPATPAYYKSKVLAERKAWSLIGAQDKTQLSVINPAGVVGPMLSRDIGTSNAFVGQIIEGQLPGCPKMHLGFVDVRDVAWAHLLAMTNDAAAGEHLSSANGNSGSGRSAALRSRVRKRPPGSCPPG